MDLLTILRAFGSVAVIFLLVGLGVFVQRRKWFPGDSWKGLGALVVNIAMPCSAFYYLTDGFTRDQLGAAGLSMLFYAGAILVTWAASHGIAAMLRLPKERRGVFCATAAFSNTVFIGVPMTTMLFGESAVKYAFMAFLPNMLLFWTVAVAGIRRDANPTGGFFAPGWAKKLINPTLVATVLALILIALGIKPPMVITQTAKTAGGMVSPVALIYCGMLLSSMGLRTVRLDRGLVAATLARFVLAPVVAFLCLRFTATPKDILEVLLAQAAMPAMSQISIVASLYGADDRYAASGFLVTTLASIVFIPILMVVMPFFV